MNLKSPESAYPELLSKLFDISPEKKSYPRAQAKMILGTYFRTGQFPQEEAKYLTDIYRDKTKSFKN